MNPDAKWLRIRQIDQELDDAMGDDVTILMHERATLMKELSQLSLNEPIDLLHGLQYVRCCLSEADDQTCAYAMCMVKKLISTAKLIVRAEPMHEVASSSRKISPSSRKRQGPPYRRPPGAAPRGKVWDEAVGWVDDAVARPHKRPAGRAPGGKAWDEEAGKWVAACGPYKRPPGRAPGGKAWDEEAGKWVPSGSASPVVVAQAPMDARGRDHYDDVD